MLVSNRYEIFTNYEVMRCLSVQFISLEDEKFINSVDFYLSAHANGFTFLLRSRFLPFSVGGSGGYGMLSVFTLGSRRCLDVLVLYFSLRLSVRIIYNSRVHVFRIFCRIYPVHWFLVVYIPRFRLPFMLTADVCSMSK